MSTPLDAEFPLLSPTYDDVCWEMVMECDQTEDGFATPPLELVTKYCQRYPEHADELIDFAATCRVEDFLVAKHSEPEPTKAEISGNAKRYRKMFRKALRHVNRERDRLIRIGEAEYQSWNTP